MSSVREHPAPARTALVTGASRGIGRHLALGLAAQGLSVGLLARDLASVQRVADEARGLGAAAHAVAADVTDLRDVRAAASRVADELGAVDLLVNNAGSIDNGEQPLWEADPGEWWRVVETNLRGPFHLAHTLAPAMLAAGGGRIVNLATGLAGRDFPFYSAYAAGKTALLRLGGSLHEAGWSGGLRTFELSPGVVRTDMTASMPMHDAREDWTQPAAVVDLLVAIAAGTLDDYSGCYLRGGVDTVDSLLREARDDPDARRLRIHGL